MQKKKRMVKPRDIAGNSERRRRIVNPRDIAGTQKKNGEAQR